MRLFFTPLILRRSTLAIAAFLIFTALYFVSSQLLGLKTADSAAGDNVSGWAWAGDVSSWISLNNCNPGCAGTAYGLNVNLATGELSGNIWSDNFGWISFNRAVTSNPRSAPFNGGPGRIASYDAVTGQVTGWARALAGCQDIAGTPATSCDDSFAGTNAGGWDGWIKLSDTNHYTFFDAATGKLSGVAWGGSDVIGSIDFGVVPAPVITFSASPTSVVSGGNSTLTWSATNAVSCNASGAWLGPKIVASSQLVSGIVPPKTYTLTCTGPAGLTAVRSVTVGLVAAAPSGTLTATACTIPVGGTSCSSTINWTTSNFGGAVSVRQGSEFSNSPSSPGTPRQISPDNKSFTLVDVSGPTTVANLDATVSCAAGSTWNGGLGTCAANLLPPTASPGITISATPNLIRSGNTATVVVTVTSDYEVACTLTGAQSAPITINHTGLTNSQSYSNLTSTLTNTQEISVACDYTGAFAGTYPVTDTERIKVIPIVQEI